MKTIQVCCCLTEKQYRDYMIFHVLGKKKEVLIHLTGCILIFLFALSNFHADSPILGWFFTILALYLLVSRYFRFYTSLNRITAQYGLSADPKQFYTLTFQGDSIGVKNQKETASYNWDRVFHIYFMEKKNMIYLYMNKTTAFLIPYSALSSDDLKILKQYTTQILTAEKVTIR